MRFQSIFVAVLVVLAAPLSADTRYLHQAIGDPDRSQTEIPLGLDLILDARTQETLSPPELAQKLSEAGILFVGESHTDIEVHRVQLRIIQELVKSGRQVLIGLEMYPYTDQPFLDGWIAGDYTEQGFLSQSKWYERWGYHWNYYRDIFLFARAQGVEMFAINAPREVVTAVRKKGFDSLSEEEAVHVPPKIDFDSDEQRLMFRSMFDLDDPIHTSMTEEQWEGMYQAQCTWDATMGFNAVKALEKHGGEDAIMVVLIGSGHVAYGLGIERQAALWYDGEMASVIPVAVEDDEGEPIKTVRASYADFIWGLPAQDDTFYPFLGLSTMEVEGDTHRKVIHVSEGSVAERSGFELGDVLLSIDGVDLSGKEPLNRAVAERHWGDVSTMSILRQEEPLDLSVRLTRAPAKDQP